MFVKIIKYIIINAIAIYAAVRLVDGIDMQITFMNLLTAGLILGVINTFIKPIVSLLATPFILMTLGLFMIIINIGLLFLMTLWVPTFTINGFVAGFFGVVIISLINYLLSKFNK